MEDEQVKPTGSGRVVIVHTAKSNVIPDTERFRQLGERGLTIRSGKAAKEGKFVTVHMSDLEKLANQTPGKQWLGNISSVTEEALRNTPTNSSRSVKPVQGTRPAQPVRPRVPAPTTRAPAPRQEVEDEFDNDAFAEADASVENPALGLIEDRMGALEHMIERFIGKKEAAAKAEGAAFPWIADDGTIGEPEYVMRAQVNGFATQARYHYISLQESFIVLMLDTRDTKASPTWPTASVPFVIELQGDPEPMALTVAHIGLQFSIGPLDMCVLAIVLPDTGEENEQSTD